MRTLTVMAALLFPLASSSAFAAEPDTGDVLSKLHESNQKEIQAGKVAQEKGQSKGVKDFGKMLVTDHTAADKKVTTLAKQMKIELPATPPRDSALEDVQKKSGAEFDHSFAQAMLDDHKKDVDMARDALDNTKDPKLKKVLATIVPKLEMHRDMAQKLVDSTGNAKAETQPSTGQGARPSSTDRTGNGTGDGTGTTGTGTGSTGTGTGKGTGNGTQPER
jgi:putative membrane protein